MSELLDPKTEFSYVLMVEVRKTLEVLFLHLNVVDYY